MPKNLRDLRERSKHLTATILNAHTVIVSSDSNAVANHLVTLKYNAGAIISARCTCPWAQHGGVACSHVIAALERLAEYKGRKLSFWHSRAEAERQKKRTFRISGRQNEDVWITSRTA